MRKIQLPVIGGVRKVITLDDASSAVTALQAQVTALQNAITALQNAQNKPNTIGGNVAKIVVGPGMTGGGPVLGNVQIGLTGPLVGAAPGAGSDGEDGERGRPGAAITGPQGSPGRSVRGRDGDDGDRGARGAPGVSPSATSTVPSRGPRGEDGSDGTRIISVLGGFTGFANPSVKVGLTAVNGTLTTALTSDSAPALDQSISPTWTGNHVFSPASGLAIAVNVPNGFSGSAFRMLAPAGTTSAFTVAGDGLAVANGLSLQSGTTGVASLNHGNGASTAFQITMAGTPVLICSTANILTAPTQAWLAGNATFFAGPANLLTADATFTSNSTLAATGMPNVSTVVAGATYRIEAMLFMYEATASAGGAQFDFGGGTATITSTAWGYDGSVNGATVSATGATSTTTAPAFPTISTSASAPDWVRIDGYVKINAAGTFRMRGAQVTPSADTTHFLAGSFLKLTRVS